MTSLVGPGRLVLVVGPSGAGKDALLTAARDLCRSDRTLVFARRVVTRPSSGAEDHDSVSSVEFDAMNARGDFAFWWNAHGNKYGIPRSINDEIRAGRTVVCNGSRATVPALLEQYENVRVVLVTAPVDVLQSRLASRQRASDGALEERTSRNNAFRDFAGDIVVENIGTIEAGAASLVAALKS